MEKGVRHYPRMAGETKIEPSDVPRTLSVVLTMWQRVHLPTRAQVEQAARTRLSVESADLERIPRVDQQAGIPSYSPRKKSGV